MEKRIIVRIPDAMYERLNKAVKGGEAKTVSELVRRAVKEFLEKD